MFVGMMPIALKFSSASRYDSTRGLPSRSGPELGLTMAILCVQSLIGMKLGAFRRGLASVKQAGEVIAANQTAFCSSGPHRDVTQFWFSINAWYSIQCPSWDVHARILPAATFKASWGILRSTPEKGHEIAALLCESRRLYARLSLFRLIESSGIASEDMANWPLSFQEIVTAGGSAPEEEYSMSALAALRDGLDGWQNSVGMNERPVYTKTAKFKAQLESEPPGVRFEPLWFQSYDAAMYYTQYAAAQALCSQHSLDVLTGKAACDESYTDEWIHLILQIVPGLRWDYDERNHLGLMWIVGQVVALRCTDPHIIAWIQKQASLLESITPDWSCVLPKHLFGPLLAMQKDLLAQGRAVMHLFTENAREVNTVGQGERQVLRVGLGLTTRKGFVDTLPEDSMVAMGQLDVVQWLIRLMVRSGVDDDATKAREHGS
ncbi:hypothetical protein CMUS01_08758 [Colletotrichum musicola]|uniref:Uncharacterized protein n=1 Tax=Colletotrichum musicola TaxID=2175873 RepID=A0A8H6KA95_9PEZI|nr:hypothetical protein CMUS01_08758 [Colletotrichum musicola]